jgi:CheY-like chemotaxis protein
MPRVLLVEDSQTQALQFQLLLKKDGLDVTLAANGAAGLASIEEALPDIVLTDLQMPEMDGLELVKQVQKRWPLLPVILMTAHGSEETAAEALRAGAASYFPKHSARYDIATTVRDVLEVVQPRREQHRLQEYLAAAESDFVLTNDTSLIRPLITRIQSDVAHLWGGDETNSIRMFVALREALENAVYHGNLEVSSELREDGGFEYYELANRRRQETPYRDRKVHVHTRISRDGAVFTVRDEGPGFDPSRLPDPADPANLEKASGRGLTLIRTFMDDVRHNAAGNEITMAKRLRKAK